MAFARPIASPMDSQHCTQTCAHIADGTDPLGLPSGLPSWHPSGHAPEAAPRYPLGYPFDVEFVIDAYMGITDAVVRCRRCDRLYLLALVDWAGAKIEQRLFRVSNVDPAAYARFAHDMSRDYCDLERKSAELHSLSTSCTPTGQLLVLDIHANTVVELRPAPAGVPTASWRARLQDDQIGAWI